MTGLGKAACTIAWAMLLATAISSRGGRRDAAAGDPPAAPRSAADESALVKAQQLADQAKELDASGHPLEAIEPAKEALEIRKRILGEENADTATSLTALGNVLEGTGAFEEAQPLLERALAVREKLFGPNGKEVANSLNNLAGFFATIGRAEESVPLFERAIAIWEKVFGAESPDVAAGLYNLAIAKLGLGDPNAAELLAERSLAIRHKALGAENAETGASLGLLGSILQVLGKFEAALPNYERALAVQEKALGPEHPRVAGALTNLGLLLDHLGRYAQALPLLERAQKIFEKSLGPEHPRVAACLSNIAGVLTDLGRLEPAARSLERALALEEKAVGPEHPDVAAILGSYANVLADLGRYEAAKVMIDRSLAIQEKVFGPDHLDVATSLSNLGLLLRDMGRLDVARPVLERSLAIREKSLGRDHIDVAGTLNNLALLLEGLGQGEAARPLYERALKIRGTVLGPGHPDVAITLHNLAGLLLDRGEYDAARALYEKSLAIEEAALGAAHPTVAVTLLNLGLVLTSLGDLQGARAKFERALKIQEDTIGREHPNLASTLNGLGTVYRKLHRLPEAQAVEARALAIFEKEFGPDHPDVAAQMVNVANLLAETGNSARALDVYADALKRSEASARRTLAWLPERDRLQMLWRSRRLLDAWLAAAPGLGRTGYEEVLREKGLALRLDGVERQLGRRAGPGAKAAAASLETAERRLSRLSNDRPDRGTPPEARARWQTEYAEASGEAERQSAALAKSFPLAADKGIALADVRAWLKDDEAVVDFLRTREHYIAWVVHRTGDVARVDLGAADSIDEAVEAFVEKCHDKDVKSVGDPEWLAAGRKASDAIVAPLLPLLGATIKTLYVAPDSTLASLPFAALPSGKEGRLLIDDLLVVHLSVVSDLLPDAGPRATGGGALLVGDVEYGSAADAAATGPDRSGSSRSARFTPLPATAAEVKGIAKLMGGAPEVLDRDGATEARLRTAAPGRRWIHLATHGFVRDDVPSALRPRKGEDRWLGGALESRLSGFDPMTLTGLALSGANTGDGGDGDDGILTALEASTLNLDGCDLVVLSACDTARGKAASGEGVLGLVRGFRLAGAQRVLASLWQVDDEATRFLMARFYEGLLRKANPLSPAEALREASMAVRAKPEWSAPRYWAAFVAYGR